jgi:hypothetical protein
MAQIKVSAVPSNTNVSVQDANNLTVNVQGGNKVNVEVTPVAKQVVQINRGVQGKSGGDLIAGYPVVMSNIQYRDVVMFGTNQWNNVNQTEISDGGNF